MKIALVTSLLSTAGGGVSFVVEALSKALVERGLTVRVFGISDNLWHSQSKNWSGADCIGYKAFGPNSIGYSPKLPIGVKQFKPDLIHSHGLWTYTAASVYNCIPTCSYVVSPHGMLDSWTLSNSKFKKAVASVLYERKYLSNSSCIHALNIAEEKSIQSLCLPTPIVTIPNGVQQNYLRRECSINPPWSEYHLFGKRILLFLGRLHPKKNIANLINAFTSLAKSDDTQSWVLVIAGWGDSNYVNELKRSVYINDMDQRIVFVGPIFGAEKDAAFRNASAFVLPSYSEGLPMAILEAWSYKLPVAITKECNLPEGFAVNAAVEIQTESEEMAISLRSFLTADPKCLKLIGENGYDLIVQRFNWPIVAENFDNLYRKIIDRKSF